MNTPIDQKHAALTSYGPPDRTIIDAFVSHLKPDIRGFICVSNALNAHPNLHEMFPLLQQMFDDVKPCSNKTPRGLINVNSLLSYLSEHLQTLDFVDVSVAGHHRKIIVPCVEFRRLGEKCPEGDVTSLNEWVNDKLDDRSTLESDGWLLEMIGVSTVSFKRIKITNMRKMVGYKRRQFFAEWIALIRLLEGDPIPSAPVHFVPRQIEPVLYSKRLRPSFTAANTGLFTVPQKPYQFQLEEPSLQENAMNFFQTVKQARVRANAIANDQLFTTHIREYRVADFPILNTEPYDEGRSIDQMRLPALKPKDKLKNLEISPLTEKQKLDIVLAKNRQDDFLVNRQAEWDRVPEKRVNAGNFKTLLNSHVTRNSTGNLRTLGSVSKEEVTRKDLRLSEREKGKQLTVLKARQYQQVGSDMKALLDERAACGDYLHALVDRGHSRSDFGFCKPLTSSSIDKLYTI